MAYKARRGWPGQVRPRRTEGSHRPLKPRLIIAPFPRPVPSGEVRDDKEDDAMKHLGLGRRLQTTLGLAAGLCGIFAAVLVAFLATAPMANAGGWATVHRYVKKTGNCSGQEILASYYHTGKRTATGERFDANGNTAAARTWALGTSLTVTNPHNGRSLTVRVNDTGPWGLSYKMGARLDLARGAAQRLGMSGTQYVCVS